MFAAQDAVAIRANICRCPVLLYISTQNAVAIRANIVCTLFYYTFLLRTQWRFAQTSYVPCFAVYFCLKRARAEFV